MRRGNSRANPISDSMAATSAARFNFFRVRTGFHPGIVLRNRPPAVGTGGEKRSH
jgi:hypothetical protein